MLLATSHSLQLDIGTADIHHGSLQTRDDAHSFLNLSISLHSLCCSALFFHIDL
jgi:hypothetical protein